MTSSKCVLTRTYFHNEGSKYCKIKYTQTLHNTFNISHVITFCNKHR